MVNVTCFNHIYSGSIYDNKLFYHHTDFVLGLVLVFTGVAGGLGNVFSIVLLIFNHSLVQLKVTWILFISMAAVDATQIIPTLVCGLLLFRYRELQESGAVEIWGIRVGGFIMNVLPFVAQLITLLFTAIKAFVFLFPFQSRYVLTFRRTVIGIVGCFALNFGLESLLFSPFYDFTYNPCTGILRVEVDHTSPTLFYYAWIRLLLSLIPFLLTICGNILLGVAVFKSHYMKSKMLVKYSYDIDETSKRTLMTAFLLVVTNVLGYSLQNGVLFCYLIKYPNAPSNVTSYPAYERIVADLLLPALNAAANSAIYVFHYLPTLQRVKKERFSRQISESMVHRKQSLKRMTSADSQMQYDDDQGKRSSRSLTAITEQDHLTVPPDTSTDRHINDRHINYRHCSNEKLINSTSSDTNCTTEHQNSSPCAEHVGTNGVLNRSPEYPDPDRIRLRISNLSVSNDDVFVCSQV